MKKGFEQDKFREHYDKTLNIIRQLEERIKERQMNQKMGKPIAGVDTIIKYDISNAQYEFKQLDLL